MQTIRNLTKHAFAWETVRLPNGAYRIQNIVTLTELPEIVGFTDCTECPQFADELNCVREYLEIKDNRPWVGLVKYGPEISNVVTLSLSV